MVLGGQLERASTVAEGPRFTIKGAVALEMRLRAKADSRPSRLSAARSSPPRRNDTKPAQAEATMESDSITAADRDGPTPSSPVEGIPQLLDNQVEG